MLGALLREKRILVCVGPGGAGKTTISAAIGARAARAGRRTLVATIDPAPRLADALGIAGLGGEPRAVPEAACRALGVEAAAGAERLYAVRLDTERTFARLVDGQVADPEMRRRIYDNTIYRQITTTLTGSQEYAATLALHDFVADGGFDLVILDTPPTANALDFLDAPARIRAAVSSPAIKWFARPDQGKRFSFQRLRAGGALVMRRLAKLVGSTFLDDLGAFLVDFQGVLGGFLERADAIDRLLRGSDVAFLLVLALRGDPAFAALSNATIADAAGRLGPVARAFGTLRASERRELGRLGERAPGVSITEVPLLDHDVDNLAELCVVGDALDGGPSGPA